MAGGKKLIRPSPLKPGDRVGVVAPAGPIKAEELEQGLKVIAKMGFEPVPGRFVKSRKHYLAGEDEDRAKDLMSMFTDPTVKGIFCARGGYGVNRILGQLKPSLIRNHPKVLLGSSDITLLLSFLLQKCGLISFHGPMVAASFGARSMPRSRKQCAQILMNWTDACHLSDSRSRVLRPGNAMGRLVGGNLTLMVRSLGTPYEIDTRNSILLIEDVNEPAYKIDGLLWQLQHAGKLKGVRGVVIGEMVGCTPPPGRAKNLDAVFLDYLGEKEFPVLAHCPIGHGKEIWTLPVGGRAVLNTEEKSLFVKEFLK